MIGSRVHRRFVASRGAVVGGAIVAALVVFAVFAPLVSAHRPNESDFVDALTGSLTPTGPNARFWFGADRLFRDVFVRVAYGARLSLTIGLAATAIATAIGAFVGIVAGFFEGTGGLRVPWIALAAAAIGVASAVRGRETVAEISAVVCAAALLAGVFFKHTALARGPRVDLDGALMRLVDIGLSFPFLLLVMAVAAVVARISIATIFVTLGITGWLGIARVIRAKTMQVKSADFVLAARALGQPTSRILLRHVLPNVAGPLVVIATISVGQMILAESVLSYLGAGVAPPTATWGRMLFEGQDYFQAAPWLVIAPGAAIVLSVLGFNLLGEGLRDALDPNG